MAYKSFNSFNKLNQNKRVEVPNLFNKNYNNYVNSNPVYNEENIDNQNIDNQDIVNEEANENETMDLTDKTVDTFGKVASRVVGGKTGSKLYKQATKTEAGKKAIKEISNELKKYKRYMIYTFIYLGVIILFVVFFIILADQTMSGILNFTNWNFGSSSSSNEVIDSSSNFSSSSSSSIKDNNLLSLIGQEGIDKINTSLTSAVSGCSGMSTASVVVKLIDGLNEYGYRVPYSDYTDSFDGVNPNWGGKTDNGNIYGFNDLSFINWAFKNSGINMVNSLDDINGNSSSFESLIPGDILIYEKSCLLVIQNLGSTIIVANINNDGLIYKEYTYSEISNYTPYSMNNYYNNNCKI